MSASSLKTIDKAIDLLWAIAHGSGASSVEELSSEIQLPKSTTYRFLKTLQTRGFVDASAEYGKYRLGRPSPFSRKIVPKTDRMKPFAHLRFPS